MEYKASFFIPATGWTYDAPIDASSDIGAKRMAFRLAKERGADTVVLWQRANPLYKFQHAAVRCMSACRWEDIE